MRRSHDHPHYNHAHIRLNKPFASIRTQPTRCL
jgi:hypothetical protein